MIDIQVTGWVVASCNINNDDPRTSWGCGSWGRALVYPDKDTAALVWDYWCWQARNCGEISFLLLTLETCQEQRPDWIYETATPEEIASARRDCIEDAMKERATEKEFGSPYKETPDELVQSLTEEQIERINAVVEQLKPINLDLDRRQAGWDSKDLHVKGAREVQDLNGGECDTN